MLHKAAKEGAIPIVDTYVRLMKRGAFILCAAMLFMAVGCSAEKIQGESAETAAASVTAEEEFASTAVPTEGPQPSDRPEQQGAITSAEAEAIALSEAGVTAEQVKYINSYTERNEQGEIYVVEFAVQESQSETQYKYDLDCSTGAVLDFHTETH